MVLISAFTVSTIIEIMNTVSPIMNAVTTTVIRTVATAQNVSGGGRSRYQK